MKLVFVVTSESGRIRPEDQFTIKQVMGSIKLPGGRKPGPNEYMVLVNKCSFLESAAFARGGMARMMAEFGVATRSVPFTTSFVKFLPESGALKDADDATERFDGLVESIRAFPGIKRIASAAEIDVSSIEEKLARAKAEHKRDMDELQQRLSGEKEARRQLESEMKEVRDDMQRKLEEDEKRGGLDEQPKVNPTGR